MFTQMERTCHIYIHMVAFPLVLHAGSCPQVELPPPLQYHDPVGRVYAKQLRGQDGRALVQDAIRAAGWARSAGRGSRGCSGGGLTEALAHLGAPVVMARSQALLNAPMPIPCVGVGVRALPSKSEQRIHNAMRDKYQSELRSRGR